MNQSMFDKLLARFPDEVTDPILKAVVIECKMTEARKINEDSGAMLEYLIETLGEDEFRRIFADALLEMVGHEDPFLRKAIQAIQKL